MVAGASESRSTNTPDNKPNDDTIRRGEFAKEWLQSILDRKSGNGRSFGEVTLRLIYKAGEITLVKATDETDYK